MEMTDKDLTAIHVKYTMRCNACRGHYSQSVTQPIMTTV